MKAVKIILGIILVLSIIFFSTGLIIKENHYAVSVEVNRPVDQVFKLFNDKGTKFQWIPEIIALDTLYFNPQITGSEFSLTVDNNGEQIKMTEKILAYIPNEKVTLFYDAQNMLKTDKVSFQAEDSNTRILLQSSYKSENSYMLSCFFPYFKGTLKAIDQQYLDNFKAYIER